VLRLPHGLAQCTTPGVGRVCVGLLYSVVRHYQAGLTVCVRYSTVLTTSVLVMDSANLLCLQHDQSPLERQACIRAEGGIGGGKWRDLVPSVYPDL